MPQVLVQAPVHSMQQAIVPLVKLESVAKIVKRVMKKENDVVSEAKQVVGKKTP